MPGYFAEGFFCMQLLLVGSPYVVADLETALISAFAGVVGCRNRAAGGDALHKLVKGGGPCFTYIVFSECDDWSRWNIRKCRGR